MDGFTPLLSKAVEMRIAITNQIRRLRFECGEMTQRELARRTGCTRQTINAIEAAKYGPSLELALKIAEVFGVGVEEVFQYEVVSKANDEASRKTP
jgi:putative transcriptional regulator